MNGEDLKADLKKLDEHCSALSESELQKGLMGFVTYPSDETEFLATRLWDKYVPRLREKVRYMGIWNPTIPIIKKRWRWLTASMTRHPEFTLTRSTLWTNATI